MLTKNVFFFAVVLCTVLKFHIPVNKVKDTVIDCIILHIHFNKVKIYKYDYDFKDTGWRSTVKPTCLHSILKYFIVVRITLKCYTLLDRGRPKEYCLSVQFEFPQHFRCFNFNWNKNLKFTIISYYLGYFTRVMHHLYWKILSYDLAHYDHKKRVWD